MAPEEETATAVDSKLSHYLPLLGPKIDRLPKGEEDWPVQADQET
jgi:hypothetical protein